MNSGLQAFIQKQREIKRANAMIETKELSQDTVLEEEIKNEPITKEINRTQVENPVKISNQIPILLKPKKPKKVWTNKHEFVSLTLPKLADEKNKYKYKVTLEYIDENGKTRDLTINFGKKSEKYLVEQDSNLNEEYALKKIESYKKCQNFFHKNYYVIELLWKSRDIFDNYAQLVRKAMQSIPKKKQQGK